MHFVLLVEIGETLQSLSTNVGDLQLIQAARHVVDILQAAAATVLHGDPQLVLAQVAAEVGHDVRVLAVRQDLNLLLDNGEVIALVDVDNLQRTVQSAFDHLGLVDFAIRTASNLFD